MKKIICLLLCLSFVFSAKLNALGISAKSYILINGDTGETVSEQNADMKLAMASTTKIMTALILCEKLPLDKKYSVPEEAVLTEGTSMGLCCGDTVSARDLLYGMMLSSGNDAANTVALIIGKSFENFAYLMNQRAKEIGALNTNFVTPSGLDSDEHYTTARDLAIITMYAMKNKDFKKAVSTKQITLCYGKNNAKHTLINHYRLLRENNEIIGVKTGFTKKAGRCLVTAAKRHKKYLIAVTLNDGNDWADHKELYNKGFTLLKSREINKKSVRSIPIASGGNILVEIPDVSIYSTGNLKLSAEINLPNMVYLPVKKGDRVGTLYCISEYKTVKEIALTVKDIKKINKTGKNGFFCCFCAMVFSVTGE